MIICLSLFVFKNYKLALEFYTFIFKWSTCLLLRLFSFEVGLRLFDTFIAEEQSIIILNLYRLFRVVFVYYLFHTDEILKKINKIALWWNDDFIRENTYKTMDWGWLKPLLSWSICILKDFFKKMKVYKSSSLHFRQP